MTFKTLTLISFTIMLLSTYNVSAQKHDNIWLFGYESYTNVDGWGGTVLDFSNDSLAIYFEYRDMNLNTTNACISDSSGNLLFYSNGIYIANATHDTIPNSQGLSPGPFADDQWLIGYNLDQGAMMLPYPGSDSLFLLIHADRLYPTSTLSWHTSTLYYTLVDRSMNNNLGGIVDKNVVILNGEFDLGKITATKHANGRDWWILIREHNSNSYHSVLIKPDEILNTGVQAVGDPFLFGIGQAVFSPDGSKHGIYSMHSMSEGNFLNIFDFDRCTGLLSNPIQTNIIDSAWAGGLAISPDSRFLYVSSYNYIYQYDLQSNDILSTKDTVAIYDGFEVELSPTFFLPTYFSLMQVGPDGRIYISCPGGVNVLHVIEEPNLAGDNCNVLQHSIQLPTYNAASMPNFPNYKLGALANSACDTTVSIPDKFKLPEYQLQVQPNPAFDYLTITLDKSNISKSYYWKAHASTGQLVDSDILEGNESKINVIHWPPGVYFLSVYLDGYGLVVERVIIQ